MQDVSQAVLCGIACGFGNYWLDEITFLLEAKKEPVVGWNEDIVHLILL